MTTDISASHLANSATKLSTVMELNNNHPHANADSLGLLVENSFKRQRSVSRMSVSSASSTNSETSEEVEVTSSFGNETTLEETPAMMTPENETCNSSDGKNKEFDMRKYRSMSDGQAKNLILEEFTDVFPSLPDSVLEKMGLRGDGPREIMKDEVLEQKFVTLALAFTIDAATIKNRCERQKRYRDQTESNLNAEINKLIDKVTCIQPLCIDAETAELLTGLLAQIDIVIRASYHAATSAERFGAVQHEERLAEAVNLMINHVTLLKQQRDSARKQLQLTKRMLQDTNNASETSSSKSKGATTTNGKIITRRRASIATVSQPQESGKSPPVIVSEVRRITRRTSDLCSRVSTFARSNRPSRLELGVDLDKIKEGIVENGNVMVEGEIRINNPKNHSEESNQKEMKDSPAEIQHLEKNVIKLSLRQRLVHKYKRYVNNFQRNYENCSEDGTLHDFFYFAALLCFMLGLIVLGNLLVEMEYSRLGYTQSNTWNRVFDKFSSDEFENKVIKT